MRKLFAMIMVCLAFMLMACDTVQAADPVPVCTNNTAVPGASIVLPGKFAMVGAVIMENQVAGTEHTVPYNRLYGTCKLCADAVTVIASQHLTDGADPYSYKINERSMMYLSCSQTTSQ